MRFPLEDPSKAEQVTWGDGNDEDAAFSPDGKRIYYTSSRGGIYNIYGQDLASGEIFQYTDVIGAALGPAAFIGPDGLEKVVFTGFQALRFQLYVADAKKPFRKLEEKALPPAAVKPGGVADFVPAVEVSIDPEKKARPKFKLFLENAGVQAGINSDQTFVSQIRLDFSDMLGNTRAFFQFDSVSSFSNFNIGLFNLAHRFQYGLQVFDNRSYYLTQDINTGDITSRRINKNTGASIDGIYPLSRYLRLQGSVGFLARTLDLPLQGPDGTILYTPRSDNVPTIGLGLSYDTTRYKDFGPAGGHSVDLNFSYLPQFTKQEGDTGNTLSRDVTLEVRQYLPISRRTLFAIRGFGGVSDGNAPNVFVFGGLDTLRGFDYASFYGNRAFYVNMEFRFPLIDLLATPVLAFGGVRGHVFLDVGGAWLKGQPFQFWDSGNNSLKDARSAYGAGFSVWFLGLPWNVDFAQIWDFHTKAPGGFQTTFFVGQTF